MYWFARATLNEVFDDLPGHGITAVNSIGRFPRTVVFQRAGSVATTFTSLSPRSGYPANQLHLVDDDVCGNTLRPCRPRHRQPDDHVVRVVLVVSPACTLISVMSVPLIV
jgi:hypothetical protein